MDRRCTDLCGQTSGQRTNRSVWSMIESVQPVVISTDGGVCYNYEVNNLIKIIKIKIIKTSQSKCVFYTC